MRSWKVKLRTFTTRRPAKDPHRRRLLVVLAVTVAMIAGLMTPIQAAQADTTDFTLSVSATDLGLDTTVMAQAVPVINSEITTAGGLGDYIEQEAAQYPTVGITPGDASSLTGLQGTLTLSADGTSFDLTIPGAEVQSTASWWESIGAWVIGTALGMGARMLCMAGLANTGLGAASIPLVCTPVGGAVAGFFQGLIVHAIDHDLGTASAWADIIIKTLLGAASGAVWEKYFSPWAKKALPAAFKSFGNWLAEKAPGLAARFGLQTQQAVQDAADLAIEMEDLLAWEMRSWDVEWSGQVIADPAYIDPDSDPTDWKTLVASPTNKLGVVVANVLNGPGSQVDAGWTTEIDNAHNSGKKVLGYVDTGYLGVTGRTTRLGSTSTADWIAQIEQDINAWYALYGSDIDGIFFDDGYNVCGTDDEYPAVYDAVNQYEKLNHPGAMTVLNPGTAVPQCYEGTADVLLTFEGSYSDYETSAYQALDWTPASPSEIWHIIYGVTAAEVPLVDETSQTRGAGYVYITDGVPANPYDTLPSFWSAEEASVPGGTPDVDIPEPYVSGAALPTAPTALAVTGSDYTSVGLTWTAGTDVQDYLVYLNGQEVVSLPPDMTAVTIGGLTPGGTSYSLDVVAQGEGGDLSAASNSVGVTTTTLPGGETITNPVLTYGSSTISYSADFLVPYSFRRVYISPPWTSSASCWWMAADNPDGDTLCARWLIENTTLLVYAGSGSDWTWTPVAYIPPTINGYTYTWTVPMSDLGDETNYVGFEGQGYGPFTDIYTPECASDCF
jgi:hypothetical protein